MSHDTKPVSRKIQRIYTSLNMTTMYASAAHAAVGQVRKYTDEPYVEHPMSVMETLDELLFPLDVLQAALLHDVIEDTQITAETLLNVFPKSVVDLVVEVTDVSTPADGDRKNRKAIDRQHLAKSSYEGASIKLADLLDNAESIIKHDPDFARIYIPEMEQSIKVLAHGHPQLLERAKALVNGWYADNLIQAHSVVYRRTVFNETETRVYLSAVSECGNHKLRIFKPLSRTKAEMGSIITKKAKLTVTPNGDLYIDGEPSIFKAKVL